MTYTSQKYGDSNRWSYPICLDHYHSNPDEHQETISNLPTIDTLVSSLENTTGSVSDDAVEGMLDEKRQLLRASILDILSQSRERQKIKKSNLRRIEQAICECQTIAHGLEGFSSNYSPVNPKDRLPIIRQRATLERQKCAEEESCWKDLWMLRKDLLNTLREYLAATRRQRLLSLDE